MNSCSLPRSLKKVEPCRENSQNICLLSDLRCFAFTQSTIKKDLAGPPCVPQESSSCMLCYQTASLVTLLLYPLRRNGFIHIFCIVFTETPICVRPYKHCRAEEQSHRNESSSHKREMNTGTFNVLE